MEYYYSMLRNFLFLIIHLLFWSALLTPLVYSLLMTFMDDVWPFSRVYDRVVLVVLVVMLVIQKDKFQLKTIGQDFLLFKESKKFLKFLLGFVLSLVPVAIFVPFAVGAGDLEWSFKPLSEYPYRLFKLSLTIFIVSFLEEFVFRIFIFWKLKERIGIYFAAILSSLFYAFAHFIAPVKSFVYDQFDILAGFKYYLVVTERILSFDLFSAFLVLFMIGLFLCYILTKSKSLLLIAGLHGGWIAALKLSKLTTAITAQGDPASKLAERYYLLTLPVTWIAVALTLIIGFSYFQFVYGKKDTNSQ